MPSTTEPNRTEIVIRAAVEADAAALASLTTEIDYPIDELTTRQRLRELTAAGDLMLVAADASAAIDSADTVIGFILLHRTYFLHRPPDGRISTLGVTAPRRNQRIGEQLVQEAERIFREWGCTRVEVTSGAPRADAHRFYQRLGYLEQPKRFIKPLTD